MLYYLNQREDERGFMDKLEELMEKLAVTDEPRNINID
jgi:hypothetical protein